MSSVKKVVLAYSGGLDTSIIMPWIKENYGGAEIIAYCGDVGQGDDLEAVRKKALDTGATECVVEDLREEFIRDYAFKALAAGAVYEDNYLLGTALARPLLAYRQVQVALARGADALAHGATGKGNDQVRFEVTYATFAPHLRIIAPWREWNIRSREDALAYAAAHNVPVDQSPRDLFSRDGNLWHLSHEGGNLEDTWNAPQKEMFKLSVDPEDAPNQPQEVTLAFERGVPVALDGESLGPVALVEKLNRIAGAHGVGRLDLVENRLVGIKSRGVYEAPGMELIGSAYAYLLQLVLDRRGRELFDVLSLFVARQIYQGYGFDLATHMARAAIAPINALATGTIKLKLYKGRAEFESAEDVPHQMYSEANASMESIGSFDHADSEGFLRVLQVSARALAANGQVVAPAWATS
jgi:argininosuccinate synthase